MNTNPDFSEKHRELVVLQEHICTITEQMSTHSYPSLSVYLNNLEHMRQYFEEVSRIYSIAGFEKWLKAADTDLFINIMSQQRSFVLLGNMLGNLKRLFFTS